MPVAAKLVSSFVSNSGHVTSGLAVGRKLKHPSGRVVKITAGSPTSNDWTWREVLPKGRLGHLESGKGW